MNNSRDSEWPEIDWDEDLDKLIPVPSTPFGSSSSGQSIFSAQNSSTGSIDASWTGLDSYSHDLGAESSVYTTQMINYGLEYNLDVLIDGLPSYSSSVSTPTQINSLPPTASSTCTPSTFLVDNSLTTPRYTPSNSPPEHGTNQVLFDTSSQSSNTEPSTPATTAAFTPRRRKAVHSKRSISRHASPHKSQICPLCHTRIFSSHSYHLMRHQSGKECKHAQKSIGRISRLKHASAARSTSFSTSFLPKPAPSRVPRTESDSAILSLPLPSNNIDSMPSTTGAELDDDTQSLALSSRSSSPDPFIRASSAPTEESTDCHDFDRENLTSQSAPATVSIGNGCSGVPISWTEDFMRSFPLWILNDPHGKLTYRLERIEYPEIQGTAGAIGWVKSVACTGHGPTCGFCQAISHPRAITAADLRAQSDALSANIPYQHLTQPQLLKVLTEKSEVIRQLRAKDRSSRSKLVTAARRLDDSKRFRAAIIENDVPRLQQLVMRMFKAGRSVNAMVAQIEKAAAGLYHAKQFNEKDRDLAQLLRHISGGSGLFAASHGCGLPSLSTAKRVTPTPPITPSPSTPRLDEIIANLRLSYPPLKPGESVERAGQVLMMDGIATTARIRRLRKTDKMVGLCREHTGGLNLSMDSFDSILKVRDAVHGDHPTCHYGKETTVAVFVPFQSTNYYPRPALLSPTCKAERAPDFAIFVALLIQGYGIVAEKIYGDLWVISTDGDAVFRLGCNQLCLVQELPQNHPLYELLCGMPGLNLTCGENFITYSSDFKHNNKRCATLCRSNQGIMIGNHIINAEMLSRLLLLLPGQTKESVEGLLDPDDHQNVPRAIKLLIAIHRLSDVNTSGLNPLDKDLLRYIAVLGALFDAFIQPFMQQEWSLYEQLKSLAIAGHLLFGLYRSHTTSFMSNQLYHDMHSVIKSIYFCVAKQKLLDNTKDIYIFQNASDRIESLFRETRTRDHNTNPDVLGLSQNVAMATDRAKIFERRPNMKQSSRRLSYDGSEGIDHVNPGYFTGDLCVGHVELPKPFRDAKFAASEVLTKAGLSFDFDGILAEEGVDFLRPFGGNVYPGLSLDHDRSIPDDSLDSSNRTTSSAPASASDVKAELEDSETDNLLHLDDFLGPDPDHPDTITTSENIPSDSLHVTQDDGTVIQMNKLLLLSTMFKDGKLSKDRIRRARGFTMPTKVEEDDDIPLGDDTLQVRDVAVCPVRLGDTIALAVLTVTGLERKGKKHLISVGESELRDSKMDVFVSGQILNLCEYPFENIPSEGDSEPSFTTRWAWTGSFASFAPLKSLQSPIGSTVPEDGSRKSHVIRIPGRFVFAVCPGTTQHLLDDTRPFAQDLRLNGLDVTSWISHDVLIDIKETEFGSMKAEEFGILPRLGASETLPYRDSEGRKSFILEEPTQELVRKKNASSEKLDCYQCGAAIDVSLLRSHVGAHILLAMTGVIEPNLQEPISNPGHACGFCGRSCDGLEMKVLARERQYRFSCPRKQTFKYVSALKPTKRQPSTNVPVYCTLCPLPLNSSSPPTFWKYSIFAHIREMHPHHWDINTRKPFNLPKEMDTVKIDELEVEMILKAAHVGSRLPISTSIVSLPFTISTTSSNTSKRSQPPVDRGGNKRQKEK